MTGLTRASLRTDLAERVFAPPIGASLTPRRIGAETELIPVETATGRRCPISDDSALSTLPFLRRYGGRQGWVETATAKGTPCIQLPSGGTLPLSRADSSSTARRPAGRRAPSWPCSSPSSCRSAPPPRTTGLPCWRWGSIRPIRWSARRSCSWGQAVWADGGVPGAARARGRPHDEADGVVPGESRFRRRAVAALAGAECGGAVHGGDLRQFPRVRRETTGSGARGRRCGGISIPRGPVCLWCRRRSRRISTSRSTLPPC